jgi:hypothetical protein
MADEGDQDVTMRVGNINYTSTGFKAQIICEEVNGDTGVAKKFEDDWKQAVELGLVPQQWFGMVINEPRGSYKVIGYNLNKPKNCISIEKVNSGKVYNTSMAWLEMHAHKMGMSKKDLDATKELVEEYGHSPAGGVQPSLKELSQEGGK